MGIALVGEVVGLFERVTPNPVASLWVMPALRKCSGLTGLVKVQRLLFFFHSALDLVVVNRPRAQHSALTLKRGEISESGIFVAETRRKGGAKVFSSGSRERVPTSRAKYAREMGHPAGNGAPGRARAHFARNRRTGTRMLWRTLVAVAPRKRSARKRWPWVLMATRSQPFFSTHLTISVAGSP